ncbi:MAG: hypothetical protein K8M05_28520, partial [Deltaproteobacteria bacterium]|nr:hypothetical protein [Kofleriaceae bacterium]
TVASIERLGDRLRARLELARASLEAVAALVIELRAREVEEVELGGDPVTEQLSSLREELDVLESSISEVDLDAAA